MSQIPEDVYQGAPNVPVKVAKKGNEYHVTSSHFPGKVWTGPDEQTALLRHRKEINKLHGERKLHEHMSSPKWQGEEAAAKGKGGLKQPQKAVKGPDDAVNIHPVKFKGESATGGETPLPDNAQDVLKALFAGAAAKVNPKSLGGKAK